MELVHRTNYWGKYINVRDSDDNKVPFTDIWTQVMNDIEPSCFRNFGRRGVQVVNYDFEEDDPVFYVSGE